jgi:hypothetical protein
MADGPLLSTPESAPSTTPTLAPLPPVDLRPLSTSALIDRGFTLYRAHFVGLLLLALLCQCAPLVGQVLVTWLKLNPTQPELVQTPGLFFEKLGVLGAIMLAAQFIVFGFEVVITFYISDAYLGRDPSVKASLRRLSGCLPASIWTCIVNRVLIGLTLIFPIVAGGALYFYLLFNFPVTLIPLVTFIAGGSLLMLGAMAPVLVVFMRLMVTVPALALEGFSGWRAVRRSTELVRYDPGLGFLYWGEMRLSFLLLPLFVIELMVLTLTSAPLTIHQFGEFVRHGATGQIAPPPDSVMILSDVLTFMAGSLILPLYSVATTLFYYDIRIRREGFDLDYLTRHLGDLP